jgi:predicted O-methyltransferase YrrM
MFRARVVYDELGHAHKFEAGISPECSEALYRTVLEKRPELSVEVGLGYGVSTLSLLTALEETGQGGRLISIDPRQSISWHSIGSNNVKKANLTARHQVIEAPDYLALPELIKEGIRIDFAYIDGWHTFDYALLDFFYLDKMLKPGGVCALNDCDWFAITKVIRFITTHRRYREIDVGLPPRLSWSLPGREKSPWPRLKKKDRYFEKLEDWEPRGDFFANF